MAMVDIKGMQKAKEIVRKGRVEMMVPFECLQQVRFIKDFGKELEKETYKNLIEMFKEKEVKCSINFKTSLSRAEQIFSMFSKDTEYELCYKGVNMEMLFNVDKYEEFKKINWSDKRVTSLNIQSCLLKEEYELICHILLVSKMKGWIKDIKLSCKTLSHCLNILILSSYCFNINIIELTYESPDKNVELIDEAVSLFTKKVGLIESLCIKESL